MSDRPILHCLVAFVSPVFGLCNVPRVMPLEDAVDYARFGFTVIVDPDDASDLARWEQVQRSFKPRQRWFAGSSDAGR